jgi:mannitol-specific phosphotransferase system IIBC component
MIAEQLELWQIVSIIFGMCATLVAPAIWYSRTQSSKTQESAEKMVAALKESTKEMVVSIVTTQEKTSLEAREDLKDFRAHFDKRIGEIYSSIDAKNKELRDFIFNEISVIKNLISELERKIDITREKSHELEKQMMKLQNENQKNFITKEHFNTIVRLHGNFNDTE